MKLSNNLTLVCSCILGVLVATVTAADETATMSIGPNHGSAESLEMGEVTFLYPETRQWTEEAELEPPCGSNARVGNRTQFPLDDGFISFIAKAITYSIEVRIAYSNNPTSNDDFVSLLTSNVSELHIGHTCVYIPDLPQQINEGDNATIQLLYMYDDDNQNLTHYACSDITFVEESVFDVSPNALSCFNATDDNFYSDEADASTTSSTTTGTANAAAAATSASSSSATSSSSSAGAPLNQGNYAITGIFAGIVMAAVNLL